MRRCYKDAHESPIRHEPHAPCASVKTSKILVFASVSLSLASLVLLPACGPGQAPPNPLPVDASADASPDAPADSGSDAEKSSDGASDDAASAGD